MGTVTGVTDSASNVASASGSTSGYAHAHDHDHDLALALSLADTADAITMARFLASDLDVATKPDLSPVSDADKAVETQLRDILDGLRPGDAVLGEEDGETGTGRRRWILDPIDGTKNYVRGVPVWATLIALEVDGEVTVGVVSAPALGRRWWAARGAGAWTGTADEARRLTVSSVAALPDAFLSYASAGGWQQAGRGPQFDALLAGVWRTRAFGDFWSHMLVAEGAVDLSCEPEVSLWDLAALCVIVEEAGGCFTDLDGERGPRGGNVLASNGLLHDAAVAALRR
ncbi:MAG: histidinol-phosphatase [Frankiaceae bacterium]|nr:histidinol-phosphatase [Frankiaceae bacterium]